MITKNLFGKMPSGEDVYAYTISDGDKQLTVLNYGGTVQSLIIPDKNGVPVNVVLGYDDLSGYLNNGGFLGALIGRFGNRIAGGSLTVDGVTYNLNTNDHGNHLHGGNVGFDKRLWNVEEVGEYALKLTLFSPDGEENYPGNVNTEVTYSFKDGVMGIAYYAVTDKKTALNMTNHAYYNLGGKGDILNDVLYIDADRVIPTDCNLIPVGGFRSVKGTPFDFNEPKTIGRDIFSDDEAIKFGGGYDHCFVLNKGSEYGLCAVLENKENGIKMSCYTDAPAIQLYTGNGLNVVGRGGRHQNHSALCLETQCIPDNVNHEEYAKIGSSLIDKGEVYEVTATYKFETVK